MTHLRDISIRVSRWGKLAPMRFSRELRALSHPLMEVSLMLSVYHFVKLPICLSVLIFQLTRMLIHLLKNSLPPKAIYYESSHLYFHRHGKRKDFGSIRHRVTSSFQLQTSGL